MPKAFKTSEFSFFPIPVFENDPASGQRYGFMPTFLMRNEKNEIISIFVAAYTYNSIVNHGGFAGAFLYPSPEERLRLFVRASENFERDYYLQYQNNLGLDGKLDWEAEVEYWQNPFEMFFGFGPNTTKSTQTNFVSSLWWLKGRVAYEFLPDFHLQLEEKLLRLKMKQGAINSLADTRAFFAGNSQVGGFNQFNHRLSLFWDTRDDEIFTKKGHYLESYFLASHQTFNANRFFDGFGLHAKKVFTLKDRFTTVAFLRVEQLFGDQIPFFLQSNLGGGNDLRAFVDRRFVGRGRILLDLEERIRIVRLRILGATIEFSLDPFFAVGQVFDRWGEVRFANLQPVGGIGFRGLAPPSVVGRVDLGFGKEGFEIFTTLDYPF